MTRADTNPEPPTPLNPRPRTLGPSDPEPFAPQPPSFLNPEPSADPVFLRDPSGERLAPELRLQREQLQEVISGLMICDNALFSADGEPVEFRVPMAQFAAVLNFISEHLPGLHVSSLRFVGFDPIISACFTVRRRFQPRPGGERKALLANHVAWILRMPAAVVDRVARNLSPVFYLPENSVPDPNDWGREELAAWLVSLFVRGRYGGTQARRVDVIAIERRLLEDEGFAEVLASQRPLSRSTHPACMIDRLAQRFTQSIEDRRALLEIAAVQERS